MLNKLFLKIKSIIKLLVGWSKWFYNHSWTNKFLTISLSFVLIIVLVIYGFGEYYILNNQNQPVSYGVTFIPDYATSLGLNPENTMKALLNIGVRQFRLTSYWSDIEAQPNQYNFSQLDWEFNLANQYHAKIILTIGLRQPRWPECHPPNWINTNLPTKNWQPQLLEFMTKVINRYKNNPALQAWQLENEYFLRGFGDCTNFSRSRYITEANLLHKLDPSKPVIITRSNNGIGIAIGQPTPTVYGISIYKRVWDATYTHRYIEYPYTNWYDAFLAQMQLLYNNHPMIITEMQAEAWPPNGQTIPQTSLSEQNKSMNSTRLTNRFNFSKQTGMKDVIMWGSEYWYYRKVILHDPSLWNVAKKEFKLNNYRDGSNIFKS